jgi:anti-sigma factor RsiW
MNHLDHDTLLDHALGLAEPARRADVSRHLEGCAACAAQARVLQAEQAALRAGLAPTGVDARAVERRVLEAARGARAAASRRRPGRQLLVAAAIGLVAGGLVLFVGREERRRQEDQRRREVLVQRVKASEEAALEPHRGVK